MDFVKVLRTSMLIGLYTVWGKRPMAHINKSLIVAYFFACTSLCVVAWATPTQSASKSRSLFKFVDICIVLKNPALYANKEISLRGLIYMGMDNTNISDRNCPGQALKLAVGGGVYEHADIREYHKKISNYGRHGIATVAGKFVVSDNPLTPYVLNVEKVWNVTRSQD